MLHLLRDLFKETLLRIEEEKSSTPDGILTHNLSVMRRAQQPLPLGYF